MKMYLYVHGQFYRAAEIPYPKHVLYLPCDLPVPERFPLSPAHLLQRIHHAEFHRLLEAENVWVCVDPHIELHQGQLLYREVSHRTGTQEEADHALP
jgi:hypothetical protein